MRTLTALTLLALATAAVALTQDQVSSIRAAIRVMINEDAIENGNERRLRMLGGLTRLSFHDCVSRTCDGCINKDNHENAGLETYILRAEQLYTNSTHGISNLMSRADFWALCGIEAVVYATQLDTQCRRCQLIVPPIEFKYGRVDCSNSPWTDEIHEFPGPFLDNRGLRRFFRDKFNFNARLTTAIMGAHTLGRAHREASGFNHPWVGREDRFNNQFYIDLLNGSSTGLSFTNTFVGGRAENRWLWESNTTPVTMMLTADMSLIKDLPVEETGQVSQCTYSTCPDTQSDTMLWASLFAIDNTLFISTFSEAFQIMIGHGYDGTLQAVTN